MSRLSWKTSAALAQQVKDLQGEITALRELALLYCQIAFRDGFRAGLLWVPDHWNVEAQQQAREWINLRKDKFAEDAANWSEGED